MSFNYRETLTRLRFRVFPEWKLDAEFLPSHFYRARALDAKLSSHPIEVDCPDANMINQASAANQHSDDGYG